MSTTNKEAPELLPCPFCLSAVVAVPVKGLGGVTRLVGCDNLKCPASDISARPERWNTRADLLTPTVRPRCCSLSIATRDDPIFQGKMMVCGMCGRTWFYHNVGGWKTVPVGAGLAPTVEAQQQASNIVREWVEHSLDESYGSDYTDTLKLNELEERIATALSSATERFMTKAGESADDAQERSGVIPK